jgi:hypothetical protein
MLVLGLWNLEVFTLAVFWKFSSSTFLRDFVT